MTEAAVRVRGLRKTYGNFAAVNDLDLDIGRGEVFGILGPNGAGKSTTVEILEGHRSRDAGEVQVLGTDPARPTRQWRSRIGIVWQSDVAPGELTVTETLRHFARYFPQPRNPDEVIELVGLTAKAKSRVDGLSGGQRRRVDVALGVIGNPELLFLDEPTTGFDPAARRQFWDLIRLLAYGGTTVVLTSHYLDEVEALANRLAVVSKGRVVASGRPTEIGGRDRASATVSWTGPDGRHHQPTNSPTALVNQLTSYFGGEIPELTVTRPSLEDIYLSLIEQETTA